MRIYNRKVKGQPYTMMVIDGKKSPLGEPALLLSCSCATHGDTSGKALLVFPGTEDDLPADRIHGFVTAAHHNGFARLSAARVLARGYRLPGDTNVHAVED